MSLTEDFLKGLASSNISPQRGAGASGGDSLTADFLSGLQKGGNVGNIAPIRSTSPFRAASPVIDIAPVSSKVGGRMTTGKKKKKEEKRKLDFFDKGLFEDGYNFGDITKTILGTAGDTALEAAKGVGSLVEGLTDAGGYLVAGAADLLGDDDFAEKTRKGAQKNVVEDLAKGADDYLDKYSVLGKTSEAILQGVGQVGGIIATGGLGAAAGLSGAGVSALTTGVMGLSGFGSGTTQAYQEGATDEEAAMYGLISGASDAITEMIFGGLGKAINAVGFSKGLSSADDMLAKAISKKFSNQIAKNFAEFGIKAGAEGTEEVLAGIAQAVGKKVTYMSEKEFTEILEDENLLEQFVVGTVTSGMIQSGIIPGTKDGSLIEANKKGSDFVTGLSQNEQAVVNKEVENRIAEREADGTKLTKKQKSDIEAQVISDMEKGYISTDTIEEVLGGDSYQSYKDTVDSEDAILKEYDELGKKQNATLAEQKRFNELGQQVEDIKANSQRTQLKDKLSEGVLGLVQNDRLVESYNERSRRGQAYEADLSQYDAKQQEVIKKAVDSGVLNNTRRTHEFVDLVAKISADKGVLFDFTNNEKLKGSQFAVDGKTVNGFVTKDGVTLNVNSSKALEKVTGHEITHVLEGTELYTELQNAIFDYAKSKGEFDGRRTSLEALYKDIKDADIDAELTADLVGDYLFSDADFINRLSTEHRNVFQKIYDEIKYLCKVATAGSKEARELERVKRAFDKAYKAGGKASGDTKYSMSDSTGKELTKEQQDYFKDSKVRDENGNLKVMYHGSQDAGFHTFDARFSDDDTSFFFVDSNEAAATYSGTTETYEAKTIRTAEDMNNFLAEIGHDEDYSVVEQEGKFTLLYDGDRVAQSDTAQGIYDEFCWYEGVGEGDANYKVYLNLTNPLEVDAKGRPWNKIDAEFSQEVYDRYQSLTAEEKEALHDLAEWEDFRIFNSEIQEAEGNALASAYAKMGENVNIYDLFSVSSENFSEEAMRENSRHYLKTRDYAQRAKEQGYDGVIFKNIVDLGGYSNGSEGAATVAIAFDSKQIKSVANEKPTDDADIRYSLSAEQDSKYLDAVNSSNTETAQKMVDEAAKAAGYTIRAYHGTRRADRAGTVFRPERSTSGPMAFFTSDPDIAANYAKDKADTSLAYDEEYSDYYSQFRVNQNGKSIKVQDLWRNLPFSEKQRLKEAGKHITWDDDMENIIWDDDATRGIGNWDSYTLNQHKGNAIEALIDSWLESGELYGNEGDFIKVLELAGIKGVEYRDPDARHEKVYDTYLKIENPFNTASVDENFISGFSEWYSQQPADKYVRDTANADMWDKNNQTAESFIDRLRSDIANGTTHAWTSIPDCVTDYLKFLGHDGIQDTGGKNGGAEHVVYIPFTGEQVKDTAAVTYDDRGEVIPLSQRFNPENQDIRYSLSAEGEQPSGKYLGRDIALAPVKSTDTSTETDTSTDTSTVAPDTSTQELFPDDLAPLPEDDAEQRLASLDDADAPPEVEAVYDERADLIPLTKKAVADIAKSVRSELGLNNRQVSEVRSIVQKYAETEFPSRDELYSEIEDRFGTIPYEETVEDIKEVKDFLRSYKINVSPEIRSDIADYAQVMRSNFGKVRFSKDGVPVDTAYQELSSMYPGSFPDDIINPADQLIQILDVANESHTEERLYELDSESLDKVTDTIIRGVNEYKQSQKAKDAERVDKAAFKALTDDYAPVAEENTATQDIAPVKPVKRKPVKDEVAATKEAPKDSKIAEIVRNANILPREGRNKGMMFANKFVDKGQAVENLSLKTGNHELQSKYEAARASKAKAAADWMMKHGSKKDGVKSLDAIFKQVAENEDAFNDYLYHLHNIDRMTLDERFGIKNKAVYGDSVTADVSRAKVKELEAAHPEFAKFAEDVYKYNRHLRQMLVDGGLISQETADLWEKEYPHYVPIHRVDESGLGVNVPLDSRKTGVNNPVKRATGGNSKFQASKATMAERTVQTYRAIARNSFGIELKNTLKSELMNEVSENGIMPVGTIVRAQDRANYGTIKAYDEKTGKYTVFFKSKSGHTANVQFDAKSLMPVKMATVEEISDSIDAHEDLLKKGANGMNPTFTVFENGERVEFEITEDLFDALKPDDPFWGQTFKKVNAVSNVRRNMLTSWNPVFALFRNPAKDMQEVFLNSQHARKTYANVFPAIKELAHREGNYGEYATEFFENGGRQLDYFNQDTKEFDDHKNIIKTLSGIGAIERAGDFIETVPRLAEYMASRKQGRSIEQSMLDAARVTTNFGAGGEVTKFANRHGFNFLNASVQGTAQHVRNFREAKEKGFKETVKLISKYALTGVVPLILNDLMWGDDEEYEELNDYVKDRYYIVGKTQDGKFIRLPKGRTAAVVEECLEQMRNKVTGNDEADFSEFFKLFMDNIAPANPLDSNILAPIIQTLQNKTWYGDDLVPSRLADLPAEEQFDESTDAISRQIGEWLADTPFEVSPVKINYLLDQYSGGFGDTFLPMITPEAKSGAETFGEHMIAPWKKELTTDSVLNNRYPGEFYELRDELEINANAKGASEEDKLKSMYLEEVGWDMSALYAEKREIQNSNMPNSEKYEAIKEIQSEINALAENALRGHNYVLHEGLYAEVGDKRFDYNAEKGEWYEITPKNYKGEDNYFYQQEQKVTKGLGISYSEYWNNREEYDFAYDNPGEYAIAQAVGGFNSYKEHLEYLKYGYNPDKYLWADKDEKGETIDGSRKKKVMDYINGLDLDYGEKIILFRTQYSSKADKKAYNMDIVNYLNSREDIDYNQMKNILEELGMTVDDEGYITW